jgi:hypothetical protein
VARAAEAALAEKAPLVLFSASGGARMHEGALSLMQMAKSCAALQRLNQAGGLFVSVMAHPTTGGVTASWAMMGDILIAEPRALIGFAGPRVIKTTIRQDLPEGFQTSEFLLEKGQVDRIVERKDLVETLDQIFHYCLGPLGRPVEGGGGSTEGAPTSKAAPTSASDTGKSDAKEPKATEPKAKEPKAKEPNAKAARASRGNTGKG